MKPYLTSPNDVTDINPQCFSREMVIGNHWDQTSVMSGTPERWQTMNRNRPYVSRVHSYYWMDGSTRIDGIALRAGNRVLAHLTPDEAIELSNRLVDLSEQLLIKGAQ